MIIQAAVKHLGLALLQIDQHQLEAMIGQYDLIAGRRGLQKHGSTDVETAKPLRRLAAVHAMYLQRLLAAGVTDQDQALTVVQPGGQPVLHGHLDVVDGYGGPTMLRDRTLPVSHGQRLAAAGERNGMLMRPRPPR